jgi:hypothetical protein
MAGCRLAKALQVGCQDVPAHFRGHPFRLQQGVHRQAVQCSEQPLRLRDEELVTVVLYFPRRPKFHDEPPHKGGYGPVAAVGLGGQEGPDPGCVLERHPDARVHGPFLVEGQELAQQC